MQVWISFANEHGFGGVVIVDVAEERQVEGYGEALAKSIALGINPGPAYGVEMLEIPQGKISENFKNRLLDQAEAEQLSKMLA